MYVPAHFKEDRVDVMHAMMREAALGTLVVSGAAGFEASHVPMLKAIVGFEMPIARLEGKWKLGQNRSAEDFAGVRDGLRAECEELGKVMGNSVSES